MKLFKVDDFKKMKDPTPAGEQFSMILTTADGASDVEGLFVVREPTPQGTYHYHEKRECVFIFISGKATATVNGESFPVEAGDIMYLAAGDKHTITSETGEEIRFFEFYTNPPHAADWVEVKYE